MLRPTIRFADPAVQARLGVPFEKSLDNLLTINTVSFDPAHYNSTGLMRGKVFLRAGGDYQQPWTRDAAVNSWNAASLFAPDVARDTLWSVTLPDPEGLPIVQKDNQWWDKVVWIVGAWNHYLVTGDREFLTTAFGVAKRLLADMRRERFNSKFGLFEGPSFFNDGIAAYPAPPADPQDGGSSFVLDHPGTEKIMALSTNCLYVGAYGSAAAMAKELHKPAAEWDADSKKLKDAINAHLWIPSTGLYGYFLHSDGALDRSQEGCGLSFAILFDVADRAKARSILAKTHREPFGITDVYPHFPRYSQDRPGRHNAIVWPMVEGMWARAAVRMRDSAHFTQETENLADLSAGSEGRFFEIYNATTGKIDGGWQNNHHWGSVHDQTWSASAYLSMIVNGLFGMRFRSGGLEFEPLLPAGWGDVEMQGVQYRGCTLEIALSGAGANVRSLSLDGKPAKNVPASLTGAHRVDIVMGDR